MKDSVSEIKPVKIDKRKDQLRIRNRYYQQRRNRISNYKNHCERAHKDTVLKHWHFAADTGYSKRTG
jgi:hypothetical protein